MTNAVGSKSSLGVTEYVNTRLKKFTIFEREGKKPLFFAEFVDADSFETTGEMMFLKKDFTINQAMEMSKLELKPVKALLKVSPYNGRSSVVCVDIQPV